MDLYNPHEPPIIESINEIYKDDESSQNRYKELESKFREIYNGDTPTHYFRAPGRVNLIGEHVDYSGYPVLPFALEQDCIIAVYSDPSLESIKIANVDPQYPPLTVGTLDYIDINLNCHRWSNYVLAAWKGIQQYLTTTTQKPRGLCMLFSGNVPLGAGVSSSSALVCVSTLALAQMNQLNFTKEELAQIAVRSERFVGIEGGGMDQTISFLAQPNSATLIEFLPTLKTHSVQLPKSVSFVIGNSLVESNKIVTGGIYYNLRVVECRLAAVLLAFYMGLTWEHIRKLHDVQVQSNLKLDELLVKVETHLQKEPYTKSNIAEILGLTIDQLEKKYFPSGVKVSADTFKLYSRAKHVYSESSRVYQFAEKCKSPGKLSVQELGNLMNDSHQSCAQLFECSCPELDQLTSICKQSGALSSRLCGAGWGGCTISMVPTDQVPQFLEKVYQIYYSKLPNLPKDRSSYFFVTSPSQGACTLILK
ncbi:galactokinase [Tieghemostelium lacteum]|uniref:Galactokinase n=1 Tax=Tieghemostelium lacteum TaxID=361077 RepID=A0A151ZGH9_TIELA|nr:galactokinase [Tieghemostelium lacteum]|eukprot:KYQ93073.1 galactokinase [Tieghemostelium lacteum]